MPMIVLPQDVLAAQSAEVRSISFREEILRLAAAQDLSVEAVVIALADILGYTAARQDAEAGQRTLNIKLHAFCARVEETYERERNRRCSATS